MLGYLSYLCGELLGLSGIVTLFCCAVAISHYALHNISAPARVTLVRSCQTLSYVSEGAIFIYVGMDTLDPLKWKVGALASCSGSHAALPCKIFEINLAIGSSEQMVSALCVVPIASAVLVLSSCFALGRGPPTCERHAPAAILTC